MPEPLESRIAPALGAFVSLSELTPSDGFVIAGEGDGVGLGTAVSSAGDLNGDGFADFVVAAPYFDGPANDSGAIYVIFGRAGAFGQEFSPSSLDGVNGFRIEGDRENQRLGLHISSAIDVNGDGFDDLVLGDPSSAPDGSYTGACYTIFGHLGPFAPSLPLPSLDGTNGFKLTGGRDIIHPGIAVGGGDVNGDGFDDLLVGVYDIPGDPDVPYSYSSSGVCVVFGHGAPFSSSTDISTLGPDAAFRISGLYVNSYNQMGLTGPADVNGDGFDDIIIGDSSEGSVHVIFGHARPFPRTISPYKLNGHNGFSVTRGYYDGDFGETVSSAGDVNGDGFDDLLIGAPGYYGYGEYSRSYSGVSYVVFGQGGAFPKEFSVSRLDGTNGFEFARGRVDVALGISAAGDMNGDGFDDLIVGSPNEFNGFYGQFGGAAYVIFGHDGAFPRTLQPSQLNGRNGFTIEAANDGERVGSSVSGIGDINGDGFDDLIVGAPDAYSSESMFGGRAYVVFGPLRGLGNEASFLDSDGDLVTIHIEHGLLRPSDFTFANSEGAMPGGRTLNSLTLPDVTTSITIHARQTAGQGDGFTSVGFLEGTGSALNRVLVDGTLGGLAAKSVGSLTVRAFGSPDDTLHTVIRHDVGTFSVDEDFTGSIEIGGSLGTLKVGGAIHDADISIHKNVRRLAVKGGISDANIRVLGTEEWLPSKNRPARTVEVINVGGDIGRTDFLFGYDSFGLPSRADAQLGTLTVHGRWTASNLALGVLAGSDQLFGTSDDSVIGGGSAAVLSAIGRLVIHGGVGGSSADGDYFGILAEHIVSGRIAGNRLKLSNGADKVALGATGDFELQDGLPRSSDPPLISVVTPSDLNGRRGFQIRGIRGVYLSLSAAGDINGDGFGDVVAGAFGGGGDYHGSAYVVFGKSSGFPPVIDVTSLDGQNGFAIDGPGNRFSYFGQSVSSAGDVNGDGIDDLIVGASGARTGTSRGAAYIIYGTRSGFAPSIAVNDLNGTNGSILNDGERDKFGFSVSGVGDVNGDGLADILVTAAYDGFDDAGAAYLVFGKRGGFGPTFNVSKLNGSNGTRIVSSAKIAAITYASSAGDVNGDGFDDFAIGTSIYGSDSGPRFVVFGAPAALGATFDLLTLDGTNGFVVSGNDTVAGAGDINGDGFDDLAFNDSYNSFVVFGHAGPFTSPFPGIFDGQNGFYLDSSKIHNFGGFASLASAGDVNGTASVTWSVAASHTIRITIASCPLDRLPMSFWGRAVGSRPPSTSPHWRVPLDSKSTPDHSQQARAT
jgi:hypothetical protein